MKEQKNFEVFWNLLIKEVTTKQKIRNWTADKGFLNRGDFTAVYQLDPTKKEKERIEMYVPTAKNPIIPVKKHSFKNVYPYWKQYKYGNLPRRFICDITRHSKYIISIMNQFENLMFDLGGKNDRNKN